MAIKPADFCCGNMIRASMNHSSRPEFSQALAAVKLYTSFALSLSLADVKPETEMFVTFESL